MEILSRPIASSAGPAASTDSPPPDRIRLSVEETSPTAAESHPGTTAGWTIRFGSGPLGGRVIALEPGLAELRSALDQLTTSISPTQPADHPADLVTVCSSSGSWTIDLSGFGCPACGLVGILAAGSSPAIPSRLRMGIDLPIELRQPLATLACEIIGRTVERCEAELEPEFPPHKGMEPEADPAEIESLTELCNIAGTCVDLLSAIGHAGTTTSPLMTGSLRVRGLANERLGRHVDARNDAKARHSIWSGLGQHDEACQAALDAWRSGPTEEDSDAGFWAETALQDARASGHAGLLAESLEAVARCRPGIEGILAFKEAIRILEGDPGLAATRLVKSRRDFTYFLWEGGHLDQACIAAERWFEAAASGGHAIDATMASLWLVARAEEDEVSDLDRLQWSERAVEWAGKTGDRRLVDWALLRRGESLILTGELAAAAETFELGTDSIGDPGTDISLEQADILLLRDFCSATIARNDAEPSDEDVPEFHFPPKQVRSFIIAVGARVAWSLGHSKVELARFAAAAMTKAARIAKDPVSMALAAKARGDVALFDDQVAIAIPAFEESVRTWQICTATLSAERLAEVREEWDAAGWQAATLHLALSACHEHRGDRARVLHHHEAAADGFANDGDAESLESTCFELAEIHAESRRPGEALDWSRRAVAAADHVEDRREAESMRHSTVLRTARMLAHHACHAESLTLVREGIARTTGTDQESAYRLLHLATGLGRCDDADGAIKAMDRMRGILASLGNHHGAASAESDIAGILAGRKQWDEALARLAPALLFADSAGDPNLLFRCLKRQGEILAGAHRPVEAIPSFLRAIGILETSEHILPPDLTSATRHASLHRQIAACHRAGGNHHDAEPHERLAIDALERAEEWHEAADAAFELAELLLGASRFDEAIALCRRGIHFADRSRCAEERAVAVERLGDALRRSGRFREAMAEYEQALRHIAEAPYPLTFRVACVRHEYGRCLISLDRFREAVRWLELSLRDFQVVGEWGHAATVAMRLSDAESELDHEPKADQLRRKALTLANRSGMAKIIAEAKAKVAEHS